MQNSERYTELIDSYLKGNITSDEQFILEQAMAENPEFKSELEFQKQVTEAIISNRKAELKARLNEIEIIGSPAWVQWGKYAAVAAIISGTATWAYLGQNKSQDKMVETVPVLLKIPQEQTNLPLAPSISNEKPEEAKAEVVTSVNAEPSKLSKKDKKNEKRSSEAKQIVVAPSLPNPHMPDVDGHESINKEIETPDHSLTKNPAIHATVAGVEVVKSKTHKFHYKYFDKKLFLYGNFNSKTYDILELNTSEGQKFYLQFENNYYGLEPDKTEITKLELVKDKAKVKELEEIQKKQ
jgi:hypothetical protein